jgi:hypothetical protein
MFIVNLILVALFWITFIMLVIMTKFIKILVLILVYNHYYLENIHLLFQINLIIHHHLYQDYLVLKFIVFDIGNLILMNH